MPVYAEATALMLEKRCKQANVRTLRAMRVLIIGGTGFIGQWVVRALVENEHEVRVFHRGSTTAPLPPSVSHDCGGRAELPRFAPLFRAWAPDVVLDTFAYDRDDLALLKRAIDEIPCRVVILSSMDVYRAYAIYCRLDEGPLETRMLDENAQLRSVSYPYRKKAASVDDLMYRYDKIPAEQFALDEMNKPVTILRLGKVYGALDPQRHAQDYREQIRGGRMQLSKERSEWRWISANDNSVADGHAARSVGDDIGPRRGLS